MTRTEDFDSDEPRMALRAKVTGEVREHAVNQFMGVDVVALRRGTAGADVPRRP